MKRLEKKLENLLLRKRFEALGMEEREWVLAQVSAEEYEAMRQTLLESKLSFNLNQPRLDPKIKDGLRKKVRQNKPVNPASKIIQYRIPAWQVVAAACVVFLLFANFKTTFFSTQQVEPYYTDTVYKVDTVYQKLPYRLVDSTFESYPDTNVQVISNTSKRINQSPRQSYYKPKKADKQYDTLQVNLPELNNSFATTYDTAVLNSMINQYLQSPADKRRGSNEKAALELIDRIY